MLIHTAEMKRLTEVGNNNVRYDIRVHTTFLSDFFFLFFFFCLNSNSNSAGRGVGDGLQLGPLGTAANYWPIVPTPGDYDDGEIGGMMIGKGDPRSTLRKTCLNAAVSTTNPICLPGYDSLAAAVGSQRLTA
jgi:hypothetical protein